MELLCKIIGHDWRVFKITEDKDYVRTQIAPSNWCRRCGRVRNWRLPNDTGKIQGHSGDES